MKDHPFLNPDGERDRHPEPKTGTRWENGGRGNGNGEASRSSPRERESPFSGSARPSEEGPGGQDVQKRGRMGRDGGERSGSEAREHEQGEATKRNSPRLEREEGAHRRRRKEKGDGRERKEARPDDPTEARRSRLTLRRFASASVGARQGPPRSLARSPSEGSASRRVVGKDELRGARSPARTPFSLASAQPLVVVSTGRLTTLVLSSPSLLLSRSRWKRYGT